MKTNTSPSTAPIIDSAIPCKHTGAVMVTRRPRSDPTRTAQRRVWVRSGNAHTPHRPAATTGRRYHA